MPQLSDLIKQRTDKKFVKKSYRPWDLSGTDTNPQQEPNNDSSDAINLEPQHIEISTHEHKPSNTVIEFTETGNDKDNDTDNLQATIRQQSENIQVTVKKQTDNNRTTNRQHIDNDLSNSLDN